MALEIDLAFALVTQRFYATGNNSRQRFRGRRLGLVGDQLAQERNQHDEHDTDREAAGAKLGEQLRVPGVGGINIPNLFEQLPQILKHGIFFVRARAIGDKSSWHRSNACPFTAAVPSLSLIEARNRSLYP